jgi:hypothetical protein
LQGKPGKRERGQALADRSMHDLDAYLNSNEENRLGKK